MTRKDDKGDQPSSGETTWTNTGATRYGRGQHKTGSFGNDMLRPSLNHETQRLSSDEMMIYSKHQTGTAVCRQVVHESKSIIIHDIQCMHTLYRKIPP